MSNNKGTLVIAPIRPQSDEDSYPSAFANEIKGGHHQVNKESQRLNIPSERLKDGMLVSVSNSNKTYQYSGGTWLDINFEILQNIEINQLNHNQILTYDNTLGKWVNKNLINISLFQTGETLLNETGITEFVIGDKQEDRGITIDYTLSRTGDTITDQFQLGRLYIIQDNTKVNITDEYVTTGDFKLVFFSGKLDGFNNNNITLICEAIDGNHPIKMNYHLKNIQF